MIVSFLRKAMRPRASQEWVVDYVTGGADPKGSIPGRGLDLSSQTLVYMLLKRYLQL